MSDPIRGTVIRLSDLTPQPWRNGRGINRNIHQHAGAEGRMGWSLSIAELTEDAAFSDFPQADRIFTLIDGHGCTLTLDGMGALDCRPFVPASFPGDVPTHCAMHGRPGRAFNLMHDRGGFTGQVMVRSLAPRHRIGAPPSAVAIHCLTGRLEAAGATLAPGDTLLPQGSAEMLAGDETALALIVQLSAR